MKVQVSTGVAARHEKKGFSHASKGYCMGGISKILVAMTLCELVILVSRLVV